jgi:hypothetical protein
MQLSRAVGSENQVGHDPVRFAGAGCAGSAEHLAMLHTLHAGVRQSARSMLRTFDESSRDRMDAALCALARSMPDTTSIT